MRRRPIYRATAKAPDEADSFSEPARSQGENARMPGGPHHEASGEALRISALQASGRGQGSESRGPESRGPESRGQSSGKGPGRGRAAFGPGAQVAVTLPRRGLRFLDDYRNRTNLAIGLLALALVATIGVLAFAKQPRVLTQQDIDKAVSYSLGQLPPPPSTASIAYGAIRDSVVRVRQLEGQGSKEKETGVGTGVVVNEEGLIITNNHVIAGATRLGVVFSDGSESDADIVSADPDRDLALLMPRQHPDELKPATLRSTAGLKVGDEVFAVGFPFGIGPSLSAGVVSGLDRSYVSPIRGNTLSGLIQFDAAANPGNSGGPLVDRQGDVVGLVTSILNPYEQRVFIGIAFAVPFEQAMRGFGLNPF